MQPPASADILAFARPDEFDAWLADHAGSSTGVWVRIAKKGSGEASVTVAEALDVALCWGWIDSQRRSEDAGHFLQRYTPRRPKSSWSQVNVDKVRALTEAGRMRPPGLAEVAAARVDGRWDAAYVAQRNAIVPDDLAAALSASEGATAHFTGLGKTARYLAILQLSKAPTPEARAARLARFLREWEQGGKA
jgi:uncharacterized protein YdeI (YjbR/CyaY-like superfamily)